MVRLVPNLSIHSGDAKAQDVGASFLKMFLSVLSINVGQFQ
jgi:hypothetical protein